MDRSSRKPRRLLGSLARLRHSPFLTREVARPIRANNRRDFHPDDRDSTALIDRWRTELFADGGSLVERLAS